MSTNTQGLLNKLPAMTACLCREARVDSYHLMTGTFSLVTQDSEKCAPTGVHDALREMVVFHHVRDLKSFNRNHLIAFGIGLGCLEMVIAPLSVDLQMRLRRTTSSLAAAVTALLAPRYCALFAPKRPLRDTIEAWVLTSVPLAVSEKRFETYVNADIRMIAVRRVMLIVGLNLTDNKGVPVSISAQNKMCGFGRPLYRAVHLDLEGFADLRRDYQMLFVLMYIGIFAVLPELDTMPAVRLLETREPDIGDTMLFRSEEALQGLTEPIGQHLYRCRWHMRALTFECRLKIVLAGECLFLLILCLDRLKHGVIDATRFNQARHELAILFLIHEKPVFKCSHGYILPQAIRKNKLMNVLQEGTAQFTPIAEARGTLAPVLR